MSALWFQMLSAEAKQKSLQTLKRKKREWILPPAKLLENTDYTHKEFIAKIRSDKDKDAKVEYYLSGPGADKPPFNLFVVDHDTGFVRITNILDREKYPFFNLTGIAKYRDGTTAEDDIPLTITVLDQNDNAPYFELHTGNITEGSKEGTFVMQIKGKDDDQAGTINAEISYSIISQEPEGTNHMFTIDEKTGKLYVKEPTLDRETYDFYKLVIKGTDFGGAAEGLTGTGTVEIRVLDINDNIPTLEKSEYSGSVDENVADVVVMRIKALDKDLEHTDNWLTVFTIAKGNEDNLFFIETDKETNEGILKLIKVLRFVRLQNLELGLLIENPKTDAPAKSYPIKISVNNVPEGPKFKPETKNIPVSEDPNEAPEDGVITVFAAVDPDTGKPAEDVSYAKAYDPDNWFTIDEETAEIKLNKVPDRESPFLVNGTYIAKVLAITKDMPSKTATGTIAIQVTDSNDHCPILTTTHSNMCSNEKTVYVTGFDEDVSPNAAPFTFRIIPERTHGNWDIEVINETSAALRSQDALWPGSYELQVEVLDAQGLSCPTNEIFRVDVCTCVETKHCSLRSARLGTTSSELSAPAIGLLLMTGFLLLFFPLLLLFCQCGGADIIFPDQFSDLPFDAKEHLMSYHTEGRGEDKVDLLEVDNAYRFSSESFNCGHSSATFSRQKPGIQNTTALTLCSMFNDFMHLYSKQKAACPVQVKDGVQEYDYEGHGSSAGSLGCCSLLESANDLQFLNDLGPKFKTLAEICPSTNISKLSVSAISTVPSSMTVPDSKVTKISHSASLSHAVQSIVLKQPVYYTTSPVPQPMHYVVQPQLQNTVFLADGANGPNSPGLYVISGPQGSPSGIVIQDIESPKTPSQPSSPTTSPVTATLVLPGSPGLSHGSVPVDSWNFIGPSPDGSYIVIKKKNSQVEAEVNPGPSQGTLPRGASLVKEAALPQGVLDLAAQRPVYVTEKGRVDGVHKNFRQTRDVQPVHMAAGTSTVGIREVNLNQFRGMPLSEQTTHANGIPVNCRLDSLKENKSIYVLNTTTTNEITKTSQPSMKEVAMKNMLKDNSDNSSMSSDREERN
uniref:Cadherin domain-containing protein n=1 Tax=Anabas testudineus TaxID=64144 RepID=A0A3Q1HGP3_ANATE